MSSPQRGIQKQHSVAVLLQKGKNLRSISEDSMNNANSQDEVKKEWSIENEDILIEWCDIAQCYKWLHTSSHAKFSYMHAWFTIPTIVFSTISGTASFAQTSLPESQQRYSNMGIGIINIFIGILSTIQQYLKISELNESHRVSGISWDKFARNIRIELAKRPIERMDVTSFMKMCRLEYDRLMETSPSIPEDIIKKFYSTFKGQPNSKEREHFDNLTKPDICNIIISANENRKNWYINSSSDNYEEYAQNLENKLKEKTIKENFLDKELNELEMQLEKEDRLQKERVIEIEKQIIENKKKFNKQLDEIYKYVKDFSEMYFRSPYKDEILNNLKDKIDLEILNKFLESYTPDGPLPKV